MRKVHQVMTVIAIIVEDPDTIPMSVRHLTRKETNHQEEDIEEMNHLTRREGVEMIVMNEDPLEEARIQKGRTSHPRATQEEGIKLMLVNGFPAPTPTTTPREAITPTPTIVKMKVLPDLLSYPPTPMTYLIHQMKELEDASWQKAPRYHTPNTLTLIVMRMICLVMMIYMLIRLVM
jgi:hypothetical protein